MNDVNPSGRPNDSADAAVRGAPAAKRFGALRRRGGVLLGLVSLLVLCGALTFGAWRAYAERRQTLDTATQRREAVPKLRTTTVNASQKDVVVNLPATTLAFAAANIYARATGYIDKRNVDIGDKVKEGQLLVQIVAPELDHQISQAQGTLGQLQAAVRQAEANLELARITWQRDEPLVAKGWVTQQQGTVDQQTLKAQQAALAVAQANVVAQQAQLEVLNQQKAYQRVVAPFDGVVTQRNIDVGSFVQADSFTGTFLFTVMQSDVIRTQVFVPQDQAFGLRPGANAVVRVPEIPGRTFPGKVTRIADALQPDTRTLLTEVDIPNPDGALRPGLYCFIEIHTPRKTPSLLVPAEAIIFNRDGLQVAVVEDGVARIRKISVVRDFGKELEVNAGVKQGDQVILNPPVALVDSSRVKAAFPVLQSKNESEGRELPN
jgi:RND family efflux transporter MFP subunit